MRTQNSIKNIYINILTQIIMTMLGFISRRIFLDSLGAEYLGINGLLTNVLSMLSLIEGGIGTSIVYNLYKPLAENDKERVISLVQLYKRIYSILAVIVFFLSLSLYPFLEILMKESSSIQYVGVIYLIFVLKNVISYLNAHKWSLINADQKGYILAKYNLIFNMITTVSKILVLIITKNYILFLIIECGVFIIQNIWNGKVVSERYSYISSKERINVDNETKNNLIKNVKALFLHNVGGYCVFGTDNILISYFINVKTVGLYSNYTMVINQLAALLTPILGGVSASVGNLIATESKDKNYQIFKVMYLLNFWIYSFCAIFLFNLLEPFIDWWLGKGLLLDKFTFIIILINFYITGMRNSIISFKVKAGIFQQDKYIPLIEAFINLASSIVLVKYLGLAGIFIGTTLSTILIPLWTQAKLVYNNIFNKSIWEYLKTYVFYLILTCIATVITTIFCRASIIGEGFVSLIFRGIICLIVPNTLYFLILLKTNEVKYLIEIIKLFLGNKTKNILKLQ